MMDIMDIALKDRQGVSGRCIHAHTFSTMIVVKVYHAYYERSIFSLFDDIFIILIHLKL